jgi:hypothetical protein
MTERSYTFSVLSFQVLRTLGVILGFAVLTIFTANTQQVQQEVKEITARTQENVQETQKVLTDNRTHLTTQTNTLEKQEAILKEQRKVLEQLPVLSSEQQAFMRELLPLFQDIVQRQQSILGEHTRTFATLDAHTQDVQQVLRHLEAVEAQLAELLTVHRRLTAPGTSGPPAPGP